MKCVDIHRVTLSCSRVSADEHSGERPKSEPHFRAGGSAGDPGDPGVGGAAPLHHPAIAVLGVRVPEQAARLHQV